MTVGRIFGRVRPFAKLRPGFLDVRGTEGPVACILIFPPPLSCTLAGGDTLFAFDIGGGAEVAITPRMLLRFDIGDRMIRCPGPSFDRNVEVTDSFYGHDLRVTAGAAVRF